MTALARVPRRGFSCRGRSAAVTGVLLLALCAGLAGGCRSVETRQLVTRPVRHSIRGDNLLVLSDFRLPRDHPVIEDLMVLRSQVHEELALPESRSDVVVYIFNNESEYRSFLETTYPGLPPRRAYFVGTPKELAVYTFWGERIQEDLRHEFTHGLLHASLGRVPLWIDEGLAEYFEVPGPRPGTVNTEYTQKLSALLANGWQPDLERLEQLDEFAQMQRVDYQEAWAWVHFALHSSPDTRQSLVDYLHDLPSTKKPTPLSQRLSQQVAAPEKRFLGWLSTLSGTRGFAMSADVETEARTAGRETVDAKAAADFPGPFPAFEPSGSTIQQAGFEQPAAD
ncbi:MAG: DUF1570 domain-containing protein [Planctomycetaceae bacterium]|nr:DUF1570 domain-containing protein [Planctomycetaceae bacterium]